MSPTGSRGPFSSTGSRGPLTGAGSRPDPAPRHEARERALTLLYEATAKEMSVVDVLRSLPVRPDPFTVELVIGVAEQAGEIDRLISGSALGWDLGRMPWVDLALLRIATYELVATATPVAVVIDEAVELAKEYSTEDSPRFVNGVLSSIAAVSRG